MREDYLHRSRVKRLVAADAVAATRRFPCPPAERNVTGQAIRVDGNVEYL